MQTNNQEATSPEITEEDQEGREDLQEIIGHYSDIQTLKNRENSSIYELRILNNVLKKILIHKYLKPTNRVVDLACGKGGDIIKFNAGKASHVSFVDITQASLEEVKKRIKNMKRLNFSFDITTASVHSPSLLEGLEKTRTSLINEPIVQEEVNEDLETKKIKEVNDVTNISTNNEEKVTRNVKNDFDLANAQFCINYFCRSEKDIETFFSNCSMLLRKGGFLLTTMTDREVLKAKWKHGKMEGLKNSHYEISFAEKSGGEGMGDGNGEDKVKVGIEEDISNTGVKEVSINEKEEAIKEKDVLLNKEEVPIKEKEVFINKEEVPIKEKEESIKEKEEFINEKEVPIKEKDVLLNKEEISIKEKDVLLNKEKISIKEKEVPIKEKEVPIKEKEESINEKDGKVFINEALTNGEEKLSIKEEEKVSINEEDERIKGLFDNEHFGSKYYFSLDEAVKGLPEYLVPEEKLSEIACENGFEVVESINFVNFFVETIASYGEAKRNSILKNIIRALSSSEEAANDIVTSEKEPIKIIKKEIWDIFYLYKIMVFKKIE